MQYLRTELSYSQTSREREDLRVEIESTEISEAPYSSENQS